jgi:hypothetical protein
MNLNDPKHPWARLTTAARAVRDDRDIAAPYGFATRVSALAFASELSAASLLERFALRAVGVAGLLALLSVAVNYSALSSNGTSEESFAEDDPIALLLRVD